MSPDFQTDAEQPQIAGYEEHPDNPDWITLKFTDGSSSPLAYDPNGTFRAQASQVADKLGTSDAVLPGFTSPNASGPSEQQNMEAQDAANRGYGQPAPSAVPVSAPIAPPAGTLPVAAPASVVPQPMAPGPIMVPGKPGSTKVTDSSIVLTPETKAAIGNANTQTQNALQAEKDADAGIVKSKEDVLNQRFANQNTNILQQQKQQAELARQREVGDKAYKDSIRRLTDINRKPIDPGAAFRGDDGGAYAFMASIGMAIANFGQNLMGHAGTNDVLAPIRDIIDRSVKIQTAQKQADFEAGRITADELHANVEEIKSKQSALGLQIVEAQRGLDNTKEELVGIDGMSAAFKAAEAQHTAASAQAQAQQAISLSSHRSVETEKPTGPRLRTPQEEASLYEAVAKVSKEDPAMGRTLAKHLGLEVSAGTDEAKPKNPLDTEEKKDLRTRLDGVAGTVKKLDDLGKTLSIEKDSSGAITRAKQPMPDVFGLHPTLQDTNIHVLGTDLGSIIGGADSAIQSKEGNTVHAMRDQLAAERAKANYARTTEFELNLERKKLPLSSEGGFVAGLNQVRQEQKSTVSDLRAHYGKEYVDQQLKLRGIDPTEFPDVGP